jgi:heat shock protein 4
VRTNAKKTFKVNKTVQRAKHVLTANKSAPWIIEYISDSGDAKGELTRSQFEGLAAGLCTQIEQAVTAVIAESGLEAKALHSVEIVGGGVRVPAVVSSILKACTVSGATNITAVQRTCDGDEAIVRGCTLACAMKSSSFNTAKFAVLDHNRYDIDIVWGDKEDDRLLLFSHHKKMPIIQKLPFKRNQDFSVSLAYSSSKHNASCTSLEGVQSALGTVLISGVTAKCKELKLDAEDAVVPKVDLRVKLGDNGIVKVTSAELCERFQKPGEDGQIDPDSKFFIRRHKLTVSQTSAFELPTPVVEHMVSVEKELDAYDTEIGNREETFNDVESYILKMKRGVDEYGQYFDFIDPKVQPEYLATVKAAADWIDDDGYDADSKTLMNKKMELTSVGDKVIAVEREHAIVDDVLDLLTNKVEKAKTEACQTDAHGATIAEVSAWVVAETATLKAAPKWETPTVKEDAVTAQLDKLNQVLEEVRALQKKAAESGDAPVEEEKKEEEEEEVLQLENVIV